jgi:hypothetical protein
VWEQGYGFLTVEGKIKLLEGPDAPDQSIRLFEAMQAGMEKPAGQILWQGKPLTREQFRQAMVDEKRLVYELEIERAYGMLGR